MIDREKLRLIAGARSRQGLFVSLYLSTSNLENWRTNTSTFLNSAFTEVGRDRPLTKDEKKALEDDFNRIRELLQYEVTTETEGLVVFADGNEVIERVDLPVRVEDRLDVQVSPYLRPLVSALALLEPYLLVRVSRDDSSVYLVEQWRVSNQQDFAGPYLKSTNRETGDVPVKEYFAAARQETLVEQHHKEVAAAVEKLLLERLPRRIVICAQHDIASSFRKLLSQQAAARVTAEIPWDAADSTNKMLARSREALIAGRNAEQEALGAQIKEGLGGGGRGAAGFDGVMAALQRAQVQMLLLDHDYAPAGWRCLECDYAGTGVVESCPVCGGRVVPVRDAAGELVRHAILQGAFVEVANDLPVLDELGGVAALLRFK